MLRVRSEVLEKLVNEAGEVAITRSRIEVEMRVLKNALADLTENVMRLRGQLREIEIHAESQMQAREREAEASAREFDPLEFDRFTRFQELTRMMAESVNDVSTVQQSLTRMVDDTDAALSAQARLNRELQQDLMRVRMVPFGTLAERLHRLVRQTAKELRKRASLELSGGSVELDRSVLERITGPLEHLVRNALTHGIEPAAERAAAGKPEAGEIRLDVRQEGNEIVLSLADDGAGLDLGKIREKALQRGLIDAAEQISEQRLAELIFVPGFSTVEQVTEIAGRGVGMDVVKDEVGGLGGRIELESAPRRGTRFTVRLPLTTAVTQAVLVKSGVRTYALPAVMIEQVQQLRLEQLDQVRAAGYVEWAGRHYPFATMHELLGEVPAVQGDAGRRYSPVLLLRSGAEAAAVLVDEMIGNQEVVVKDLGPQLARVPGVAGVTVLGSGEIVLILNPVALVLRPRPQQGHVTTQVLRTRRGAIESDGRGRLAHGAQDHRQAARARGLPGPHCQGRGRSAGATFGNGARCHAGRHRDAAHGRLRPDAQCASRSAPEVGADHHDYVAHGGQASRLRAGSRRQCIPRQALPGGTAAGAHRELRRPQTQRRVTAP